ncbi:type II toxin-antitoxin system HicA family toxin [Spirosoma sp. KCTC 42546]|uniref:type II toxin-antitoxin system HicA family toxin n=1 Tax=Spirosoma sp. KCTC 42546 TaxID=2520506 RepID=UPI00115BBA2F|nr:type II toxin-antitoxin system HicA family toxin [Spirosoma sp. KCTC 42546]QDK79797.1 type II toxin-antitoxin system HicA family toxin [Spirosoma sp. KCTC 42546]
MSEKEKLLERFQAKPTDFSWNELVSLLAYFGYEEVSKGKTEGSRRAFVNPETKKIIRLHKPHPGSILKQYQLKEIQDILNLSN